MYARSLKFRLLAASSIAVSIWLLIAGVGFYLVFQRYVERLAISQLEDHYLQLINNLKFDEADELRVQGTLSDPRFARPYGGLYWQINEMTRSPVRSMSLFDTVITLSKTSRRIDGDLIYLIEGPNGSKLFSIEKKLVVKSNVGQDRGLSILLAVDRRTLDDTVGRFGGEIMQGLMILFALLLGTLVVLIVLALRPLQAITRSVGQVRLGDTKQIVGKFPNEVRRLVDELNGLLAEKYDQLARTRMRASNLAHGLKTPLTVMSAVGDSVERSGLVNEAREIHENSAQMFNLVERELARARMATGYAVQLTPVLPVVARLVGAQQKTSNKTNLIWQVNIPAKAEISIERGDFLELVGIILDNAQKWANSKIIVSWLDQRLKVEDDGLGVPESKLRAIQERGVRLDESVPGSGLGLSIARDIVEIYGYNLVFAPSNLGGLGVVIEKR